MFDKTTGATDPEGSADESAATGTVRLTFIEPDGSRVEVDAEIGDTLMMAATEADINGIIGDCGGACTCATCHLHVEEGAGHLPPVGKMEDEMLDFTAADRTDNSRLGCQVTIGPEMAGLVLRVADRQT